jgi:hypothetical protein
MTIYLVVYIYLINIINNKFYFKLLYYKLIKIQSLVKLDLFCYFILNVLFKQQVLLLLLLLLLIFNNSLL